MDIKKLASKILISSACLLSVGGLAGTAHAKAVHHHHHAHMSKIITHYRKMPYSLRVHHARHYARKHAHIRKRAIKHHAKRIQKYVIKKSATRRHYAKKMAASYYNNTPVPTKSITRNKDINRLGDMHDADQNIFRKQLMFDINEARIQHGLQPLQWSDALQKTANYRAPKVLYAYEHYNDYKTHMSKADGDSNYSDAWVHGEWNHTAGNDYLKAHHYACAYWFANAAPWSKNYTHYNYNCDRTPLAYNNNNMHGVADNVCNVYLNHDSVGGNNNGHRNNILNPYARYIGIATAYDPSTNTGADCEQFGTDTMHKTNYITQNAINRNVQSYNAQHADEYNQLQGQRVTPAEDEAMINQVAQGEQNNG